MTTADKALWAVMAIYGLICGAIFIGALIFFLMFVIELAARCWVALPIAIVCLAFAILKVLACQPR